SSSKCTNEENYLLQRFARCVLGTNNIDNGSRLYNAASRTALGYSIGLTTTTNHLGALEQLEQSEVIIVIGANPTSSAPLVEYAITRAVKHRGARLILIDPRRTDLSSLAHLWLRPRVGTDVALLNILAKVIIDEGLFAGGSVTRKKEDFKALTKALAKYSPDYAENISGVPSREIHAAAQLYAKAGQAAIVYGSGITQNAHVIDSIKSLVNLAMLTGNIERVGGGIYALQRDNNGQGACDMGALPDLLPGYESVADAQARRKFEEHWKVNLPAQLGLTAIDIMDQVKGEEIKGMWIVGENPVLSFPHGHLVADTLASLDFLVVQEMFLTETAKLATVVLPSTSFAEKEGTFTNFEGRVNRVQKAIEPLDESLPDWEIILRLAGKMNNPLPFSALHEVTAEIEKLVPRFRVYPYSGKRTHGEQSSKGFTHFMPVEHIPRVEKTTKDYPLTLLTGTILYHFGSGTRSFRAWRLKKFYPQSFVEIGESSAKKLGIKHGDDLKLISPTGELTAKASITDTLPDRMLFMPVSLPEAPVSALFDIILDPETKAPLLKACNVRIERIGD
ncbi:MAG: molybdopterin-dependent oxidoreductase, partial [Dehalococcoidales bacterium]